MVLSTKRVDARGPAACVGGTWLPTLLLLLISNAVWANTDAWVLSGDSLLCELSKMAAGPNPPGIYAVGQGGELHRVVVYGQRPRWSPARDRFVFWRAAELTQWVRKDMVGSQFPVPILVQSDEVMWSPDGARLVMHMPARSPGDVLAGRALGCFKPGQNAPPEPLLELDQQTVVGKWSVSPRADHVAFEALGYVSGFGATSSAIRIATVGQPGSILVDTTAYGDCVAYGPQWRPGSETVAFTLGTRDGARFAVALFDTTSRSMTFVGPTGLEEQPAWDDASLQFMSWSPDGSSMVVRGRPFAPLDGNALVYLQDCEVMVVRLRDTFTLVRPGGPALKPVKAVWSPDGRYVAVLRARTEDLSVAQLVRLQLLGQVGTARELAWTIVPVPEDLRVVDIDW